MSLLQKCDIKGKVTFLLVILLICFSITGGTYQFMRFEYDASESHVVTDSLNDRAYAMRYCHHDSAMIYAQQAEASAGKYEDGRIESKNHRLFQACLDIDCVKGNNLYDEIQKGTKNQIELLISEISMMMMCQRTAQNLLYTEYQKRAVQRMSRIEEEENLEGRYAERYFYALNEYKFIEVLNALQLSKIAEAETEIDEVYYNEALRDDKSLWTDYHYIKGLISLNKSATDNNEVVKAFDYLFQAYAIADRYQLIYLKSLICQVFSEMLSNSRIDHSKFVSDNDIREQIDHAMLDYDKSVTDMNGYERIVLKQPAPLEIEAYQFGETAKYFKRGKNSTPVSDVFTRTRLFYTKDAIMIVGRTLCISELNEAEGKGITDVSETIAYEGITSASLETHEVQVTQTNTGKPMNVKWCELVIMGHNEELIRFPAKNDMDATGLVDDLNRMASRKV